MSKRKFSKEFLASQGVKKPGMSEKVPHKFVDEVEHKWCGGCEEWKTLEEYNAQPGQWDGLCNRCRKCRQEWERAHKVKTGKTKKPRGAQAQYHNGCPNRTEQGRLLKHFAIIYKGGKCEDCGRQYDGTNGCGFDFHHVNGGHKDINPSHARCWKALVQELDKTTLLCSWCHRLIENSLNADYIQQLVANIKDPGGTWPPDLIKHPVGITNS